MRITLPASLHLPQVRVRCRQTGIRRTGSQRMRGSGKGRTPLVADRRYRAAKGGGGKPAAKPSTPRKRRPARRHGLIVGLVVGLVSLIWRIVWGVGWRVGLVVGLLLAGVTFYFEQQLPDLNALLDARARGSVTLLDRDG